jgi:hypothetical protein
MNRSAALLRVDISGAGCYAVSAWRLLVTAVVVALFLLPEWKSK